MTSVFCAVVLQAAMIAAGADEAAVPAAPVAAVAEKEKTPSVAAKAETYDEAHRVTEETGKPMVVMVGTDWCGPCQAMKRNILPRIRERGLLRKVAFAIVNADRDRDLAQQLTGGGPVPQMVMFRKTANGWMRRKLVGGQSEEAVEQFINEGIALDAADKEQNDKPEMENANGLPRC